MNSPDIAADIQAEQPPRDDLACPRCAGPVTDTATELVCSACGSTYPIRDGIADLRCHRYDYYFNPVPRTEMEELTRAAQFQPWERTIHRFLDNVGQHPDWFDDLVVDGRYAWKLFLRLPPNARVLDLGCGLGNLVKNIAPSAGRVDALDLTLERLKFARVRFQRFNSTDDIRLIAGGDGPHLPFPGNSFDCVTLSGVLEWVAADDSVWAQGDTRLKRAVGAFASFFGKSNPRKVQIRFLEEINRVLKPDGQLFIAIENRTSYGYFGKRRDHHSGLWFASLLPRFLANVYSIFLAHRPYRTYTYSVSGCRRLLRAAGFSSTEFVGLTPGYTQLAELIPLQLSGPLWSGQVFAGMERLKRSSRLVPAYGVMAARTALSRSSLAERLAGSIADQLGTHTDAVCFSRFQVTEKNKGIIHAKVDGRPIVLKVPFNEAIAIRAASNHQLLEQAQQRETLRKLVPRTVGTGEIEGIRYYAEEYISGRPLRSILGTDNGMAWFGAVSDFLDAVNPELQQPKDEALSGEMYKRQVLIPLEQVGHVIDSRLAEDLRRYFDDSLNGLRVRFGVVHGDLSCSNIFVQGTSIVGVIDWDDGDLMGLPMLDAVNFVDSLHRGLNHHAATVQVISRLAQWHELAHEEKTFLENRYRGCGINSSCHSALVCLYWLRHVADQLDGNLIYDRPAIDERITSVFERVLQIRDCA